MAAPVSISVLIPVFNTARYIEEAIASILAQTLPATEIIVIDDGSSDESAELASRFPGVKVLRKNHTGIADTLNHGLARATGDWLAFLDADDFWAASKLERQMSATSAPEAPDLVFGCVEQFYSGELAPEMRARIHCPEGSQPGYCYGAMLARRVRFQEVGAFDARWTVGCFVDWYARAQDAGLRSVMLPDVFLHRRLHANNTGRVLRDTRPDFARIVKASLDRRRAAAAGNEK